jgi:hypothetical protein
MKDLTVLQFIRKLVNLKYIQQAIIYGFHMTGNTDMHRFVVTDTIFILFFYFK